MSEEQKRQKLRERVARHFAKSPGANAANIKRKKEKYKAAGLCPDCGVSVAGTGFIYCRVCIVKKNKKQINKGKKT